MKENKMNHETENTASADVQKTINQAKKNQRMRVLRVVVLLVVTVFALWRAPGTLAMEVPEDEIVIVEPTIEPTIEPTVEPTEEPTEPTVPTPAPNPNPAPVHTHHGEENSAAATCINDGYCRIVCDCGEVIVDTVFPALGHHHVMIHEEPAQIGVAGYREYKCVRCEDSYREEIPALEAPAHEHTLRDTQTVAPTCTETGLIVTSCTDCGEVVAETVIDALGHTEGAAHTENEVLADCVNNGRYDYVVNCAVCNAELTRETEIIPALGHVAGAVIVENVVDATCTIDGSYDNVVYCDVCQTELSRETITTKANGHIEAYEAAVAATCTTDGLTEGSFCSVCKDVLKAQVVIPAMGHDYEETAHVEPQIGVEGYIEYTCVRNDDSYREVIAALEAPKHEHNIGVEEALPTCTEDGIRTTLCVDCHEVIEETIIPALGHDHVEATRVEAQIGVEGYIEYVCTRCEDSYKVIIPALEAPEHNHVIDTMTTAATCTEDGLKTTLCTDCNEIISEEIIPAFGHNYQETARVEAAIEVEGYVEYTCSNCGDTYVDVIPALPKPEHKHELTTNTTPATCVDNGVITTVCTDCGEIIEEVVIEATGHNYQETARVNADIEIEGYVEYTCVNCSDSYVVILPALEKPAHTHELETIEVAATCTTEGSVIVRCVTCDEIIETTTINAIGHNYQETARVDAQIGVEGFVEYTCTNCGDSYLDTIPALEAPKHEHTLETIHVDATCNTDGQHVVRCTECGEVVEESTIPAHGHNYQLTERVEPQINVEGYETYTCSHCGDVRTTIIAALPPEGIGGLDVDF